MVRKALEAVIPKQPDLAKAAGISYHALRQYARGQRTAPPDVVRKIARALREQGKRLAKLADQLEATARTTRMGGKP